MDKTIKVNKEAYERLKKLKEKTLLSYKNLITIAVTLLEKKYGR
jgi:predicted CopG family antitoxin